MKYILNSLEEIQKVYVPNIETLNDGFLEFTYDFKFSKSIIYESMKFYELICFGEDCEKESLSLRDFNIKNKNHFYKGINYDYLIKNIDVKIFEEELIQLLSNKENDIITELEKILEDKSNIFFEKKLEKTVKEIEKASETLEEINLSANKFDKILIKHFTISYQNLITKLKNEYAKVINNKEIFEHKFIIPKNKDGKYNEELFNNILRGNNIYFKESKKEKTNTIWFEVGKLIAIGEIEFRKQNNGIDIYYKGNKQKNGSKLAEELTQVINYKKDSIKAYINDTKSNLMIDGRKNIFISLKNANKLMEYCTDNKIKPSVYLINKIKELESIESLK